ARKTGEQAGLVAAWVEARWLEGWLRGYGGRSFAPDGTPTLNTPQMVSALNLLKELRTAGPPQPSTYLDGARLFRRGEAAYAIDGDWAFPRYRSVTETLDLGFAPLPRVPATGLPALAPLTSWYVMYSATLADARLEGAHTLGAALTEPDMQRRIAAELHFLPARTTLLADAAVTSDPALAAEASGAAQAPGIPPTLGVRCYWNAAEIVLPAMLLDEIPVDKAAERLQERTQNCIDAG
ncbi:MAG TPA: extracellular solute-binding protein, partial [Roseiflexaceae bacterium]|nr:extracellular solute-binding protein [Roseiflexaceae bacterium]